jgi:hypothetical protein
MSASSGNVSVRFDVQGSEQLINALKTIATSSTGLTTSFTSLQGKLNQPIGGLGPLQQLAAGTNQMSASMTAAEGKVTSFKTKLAGIGSQLSSNATSFGVATASIWGVYNAYDSLEKVQIRAHSAAVRVQTLETTLASLTERRRIAVEKGNLTGEQMAVLNERIADTQDKLSVAQERSADVSQDVQEAWAGFISQIGPQAIAATGSVIQLANAFKGSFSGTGGVFNTLKGAISGIIPAIRGTRTESLLLSNAITIAGTSGTGLKGVMTGLVAGVGPLASGFKGLTGFITPATTSMTAIGTAAPVAATGLTGLGASAGVASIGLKGLAITAGSLLIPIYAVISAVKDIPDLVGFLQNAQVAGDPLKPFQERLEARKKQIEFSLQPPSWNLGSWGTNLAGILNPQLKKDLGNELVDINKKLGMVKGTAEGLAPTTQNIGQGFTFMGDAAASAAEPTLSIADAQSNVVASGKAYNAAILTGNASLIKSTKDKWEADKITLQNAKSNLTAATSYQVLGKGIQIVAGADKQEMSIAEQLIVEKSKHLSLTAEEAQAYAGVAIGRQKGLKLYRDEYAATQVNIVAKNTHREALLNYVNALGLTSNAQNASIEELKLLQDANLGDIDAVEKLSQTILATSGPLSQQISNFLESKIAAIDYTQALTDMGIQERLIQQGTLAGIQQADQWFQSLVKNTAQEAVFNSSLAEGAKELGINADMLAFSSSKMQELIKTTYEQTKVFGDMQLAAAKSTAWLNDMTLKEAVLGDAQIKGAQSANDWTISMISSVEAAKSEHDQLVALAEQMTGLNNISNLSTEQLHALMTAFQDTGSAAFAFDKILNDKLRPSFENFKGIFDATTMKEFDKAWKELGKSGGLQGIPKDLKSSLKDIGQDLVSVNKHAKEASNVIDALLVNAYSGRQKGSKSGLKALLDDVKDIPGNDKIGPFKDALKELIGLPKDERTKALLNYTDAFAAYKDAVKPDSPGGTIITSGEAENINKLTEAAKNGAAPLDTFSGSIDGLATSAGALANIKLPSWITDRKAFGEAAAAINPKSRFANIGKEDQPTKIPPPAPIVFPPPDLSNILAGVSKAEIMMSEMVKYAAGLTIAFPLPKIDNVITAVSKAQIAAGDVVGYIAGLKLVFPKPIIDAVITGVSQAQIAIGDVGTYIAGLPLVFQKPDTKPVTFGSTQANATIKTVATFISGSSMKLAFQAPNIVAVANQSSAAKKAIDSVKGEIDKLVLKFPKPNISEITSGVNEAQKKIDSLHGTTVTNHVKTVFDNAGGNILNDARIMSAAAGKLFTTNGEQLFRVGDNPGGRETIAMIPHDKPNEIMERLNKMFPPIISTLHERARRPSMQTVSGHAMTTRTSAGPTQVNVTTQVYLFPGSQMFKQYVKQIMLEDLSRYATA